MALCIWELAVCHGAFDLLQLCAEFIEIFHRKLFVLSAPTILITLATYLAANVQRSQRSEQGNQFLPDRDHVGVQGGQELTEFIEVVLDDLHSVFDARDQVW